MEHLERSLAADTGPGDSRVAVLFCDIDRFKSINNSFGRDAGDLLLISIAGRIRAVVDRAYRGAALVGRIAADEFVVICEAGADSETTTDLATQIHAALEQAVRLDDDRVKIQVSIGIALADSQTRNASDLIQHAEAANVRAKAQGRDRIETFDSRMRRSARERLRVESDLAGACERGEMRLFYQPILHVGEQRVTGLEALIRWRHPKRGLLSPNQFIPLAEETGLIRVIGDWAMEEAFTQSRRWHRAGITNVRVGVNISARQLNQDGFVESVTDLLDRLGPTEVHPHFELTESVLMSDPGASARTLHALRELGVRLSLDDFGTGYSSLAYLQRFPVDVLKIDRSFIAHLGTNARNQALVRAMVQLGHALGLLVVAEGIETESERAAAVASGCDLLQGFLIGRPTPADMLPLPTFLA